jgi:hypothetical protein
VPGPSATRCTGITGRCACCAPRPVTLAVPVKATGPRWTIGENSRASKSLTGLGQYQVRRWASWYRWVTLAMLAAAVLAIAAIEYAQFMLPAQQRTRTPITKSGWSMRAPAPWSGIPSAAKVFFRAARSAGPVQTGVTALRSLLQFVPAEGLASGELAGRCRSIW